MEHRHDRRRPVKLSVSLFRNGQDYGRYQATNVGSGGLFLEDCSEVVCEGDFFVAQIEHDLEGISTLSPMKAMAIHRTESGIGLMWVEGSPDFYKSLDQLIETTEHTNSAA